jgi:hypothetical protein
MPGQAHLLLALNLNQTKNMKKTIISASVLLVALSLAITSCKKGDTGATGPTGATGQPGSSGSVSPYDAPKAPIDRFSTAAGHLQVRSSSNGLPAPNAPVNFDQAPFITTGFGPTGDTVIYYNFDVQPTAPAPIYVLQYANGAEVAGQINIVNVKPGNAGYNDFWLVNIVTVPSTYVANTIKSYAEVASSGYSVNATTTIVNCPIVPYGSTAVKRFHTDPNPGSLIMGWYRDSVVYYFSFGEKALSGNTVPTSPIYVTFNNNSTGPASGFMEVQGSMQTHNVVGTVPTSNAYSPLWQVNAYNNSNFSSVTNLSTVQATSPMATGANVNCPIVEEL